MGGLTSKKQYVSVAMLKTKKASYSCWACTTKKESTYTDSAVVKVVGKKHQYHFLRMMHCL